MDPRNRADEALARSQARSAFVVTPDSATSPMDAAKTVRIPRESMRSSEDTDPNSTTVIRDPAGEAEQSPPAPSEGWPSDPEGPRPEHGEETPTRPHRIEAAPSYPHDPRRSPQEFG
ncbi:MULTISPECIES: hypothetical protein [Actinopolyspora]|uniref:Uncharacterized protein n=1 Tax=Actinopolyspora saharensis TaxID=995062 RepID=A0A1H1EAD1_9ACTN|nr:MULTISPECIES: hypothetical protein [Actinopolyspora]NHD19001.1 hypothetical protein [Actinopolyspora sp. BKK2]NHE78214.1 hypothetical protein [Actinopolyspora sp. BKK1]SDQ85604.1 hypothetical protein SAMN04489718_2446 [Actinopolyspora saharensis]